LEQFRENIKELLTQWRDIENLYKQFLDSNVDKSFATVATAITFALKFKKIQEKISKFEEKPLNSYQKEELEDFWSEIDPLMTSLLDLDFFTLVASVDTPNK
jgi:S-methylmethionine-dependent homocysteine/selenocysteine methylase